MSLFCNFIECRSTHNVTFTRIELGSIRDLQKNGFHVKKKLKTKKFINIQTFVNCQNFSAIKAFFLQFAPPECNYHRVSARKSYVFLG